MPIEAKHTPKNMNWQREKSRAQLFNCGIKKDIQHKQQNRIVVTNANCESVIRLKTFYMEPEWRGGDILYCAHAIASFNTEIIQFIQFIQFLIQFAKAKLQQ